MRVVSRSIAAILAGGFVFVAYLYLTLPDVRPLATANPETTAFMELRAAEARSRGETPRRDYRWVPYRAISRHLARAVLVAEDAAFWTHDGVDLAQLKESIEVNLERREFARGASTITQQLAKNLYLTPSKNPIRKLRELFLARLLEAELSKARILELYLNVIEWGDGIYGAEAAARTYFRKPASALQPAEAALLAAAIINPRVLNPGDPSPRLLRRRQMVLRRMRLVRPPDAAVASSAPPERPAGAAPADAAPPERPESPLEIPGRPADVEDLPPPPEETALPSDPVDTDPAPPDARENRGDGLARRALG